MSARTTTSRPRQHRNGVGEPVPPALSAETLNLCAVLLSQVTLTPTADDFEEQARVIAQARRELLAALSEVSS